MTRAEINIPSPKEVTQNPRLKGFALEISSVVLSAEWEKRGVPEPDVERLATQAKNPENEISTEETINTAQKILAGSSNQAA